MSLNLSVKAYSNLNATQKVNQIILEIEGIDLIYGTTPVYRLWNVGEGNIGDSNLYVGGVFESEKSRPYIEINGTTRSINQQIKEKGGSSSVSRMDISLVDKNSEVSNILAKNNVLVDPIGVKVNVYVAFSDESGTGLAGAHPSDSIKIYNGTIDALSLGVGTVKIGVSHPENIKRQDLFVQQKATLVSNISSTQTSIQLDSVDLIYIDGWIHNLQKMLQVFTVVIVRKRYKIVGGQPYSVEIDCQDMLYFLQQSRYITSPSILNQAGTEATTGTKDTIQPTIYSTKLAGLSGFEAILSAILSDGSQKSIEDYLTPDGRVSYTARSKDSDVLPLRAPILSRIERILAYPYTMERGQKWSLVQSESKTRLDICKEISSNLEVEFLAAETG